jgi:RecA-family ATPase
VTGSGAVGKSSLRILQLIALALGRGDLVGEHVYERVRVLLTCLEDDEEEVRRRTRAACLYHGLDQAHLDDWFFYWCPWPQPHFLDVKFADLVPGELGAHLQRIITTLDIGLVTIDPFVRSHGVEENSNPQISAVANALLGVGYACGCAVDYVHHHRKGVVVAGDSEAARGARALVDASRLVKTATTMTSEDAGALGVDEADRRLLFRVDDAKLNFAPPATETTWFRLVGEHIGNATEHYPHGDTVQTVELWRPANIWRTITPGLANLILDDLDAL